MNNEVKGFTLIELMMVLALAAVLLTIAVPSFQTFTKNSKITKQVNLLAATINTARGEAAKRGARVVVCQSDDPVPAGGSKPSCSGNVKDWSKGWVAFVDADNNLTIDAATDVVNVGQTSSNVNVAVNGVSEIVFNPDGSTTVGSAATFAICDSRGKDHGKEVTVSTTGRASSSDATTCTP